MRFTILGIGLVAAACSPRVGTACDMALAQQVVFDERGVPAYAGQSILISSCAGGGWSCHTSQALHRYSAPAGTDLDVLLADEPSFDTRAEGESHLQAARLNAYRLRDDVFSQVSSGNEPPGAVGSRVTTRSPQYRSFVDASDTTGTLVPSIRTADGREILRNWLACTAPVLEATTVSTPIPCTVDSDCTLTSRCDAHACANVGDIVAARGTTTAHWSSLYDTRLAHSCGLVACHDAEDAEASGHLDLSTSAIGFASVSTQITPMNPDASVLVQTLTTAVMPYHRIDAATLALIRDWIRAGASMD